MSASTTLAAVPQVDPVTIDGVTYTIKSEGRLGHRRRRRHARRAATRRNKQSEYLHITSTVTSNIVGHPHPPGEDRLDGQPDGRLRPGPRHARRPGRRPRRRRRHRGIDVTRRPARPRWPRRTTDQNGCVDLALDPDRRLHGHVNTSGYSDETGAHERHARSDGQPEQRHLRHFAYDRCVTVTVDGQDARAGPGVQHDRRAGVQGAATISDSAANATAQDLDRQYPADAPPASSRRPPLPVLQDLRLLHRRLRVREPGEGSASANYFTTINPAASHDRDPALGRPSRDRLPAAGQHARQRAPQRHRPARRHAMEVHLTLHQAGRVRRPTRARTRSSVCTSMDWPSGVRDARARAADRGDDGLRLAGPRDVRPRACRSAPTRSACWTQRSTRDREVQRRRPTTTRRRAAAAALVDINRRAPPAGRSGTTCP